MDKLGRPADKMRVKKVLEEFYRSVGCSWLLTWSVHASLHHFINRLFTVSSAANDNMCRLCSETAVACCLTVAVEFAYHASLEGHVGQA